MGWQKCSGIRRSYLEDALRKKYGNSSRLLSIILTYFPPAVLCIFEPEGFLSALAFAGISFVLWSVLLPPILLLKARKRSQKSVYNFPGSNNFLRGIIFVGIIIWMIMFYYLVN